MVGVKLFFTQQLYFDNVYLFSGGAHTLGTKIWYVKET